ncbi:MAG: c-type cytochrome [Sphingobacteriales bacterium]|uniref:cbb3-type cytochrome c oxidase N-terminal domain-containing protein n=1 Tax=Hydrotalea flava TaxID=714549 RepID=UPI000831E993|nr:cbb3-type cytochrome c oxidase N-terminal domain-containing protein [Hydrotalea flava]RTL55661.1 MAG: c-type cytochrome [Sphingobacteriales bacterium]
MNAYFNKIRSNKWLLSILALLPVGAFAAGPPQPSSLSFPVTQLMVVIIIFLLIAIVLLANVLVGAAKIKLQEEKEAIEKKKNNNTSVLMMIGVMSLLSLHAFGADNPTTTVAPANYGGLTPIGYFTLVGVVLLELLILLLLIYNIKFLLRKQRTAIAEGEVATQLVYKPNAFKTWWANINRFKPIKEEAEIDLGHDYDGIRELDNRLPPWWLYGFYASIIFAGIYLVRYHVLHSAPLSKEELQISLAKAEAEKQAYLKESKANVDENTVKYLTDASDLEAGKQIFTTTCAACHLADGGGLVGPNLTDDYWLHGCSIKDIFKSITYGWPEKGMKSWKDDYSPLQIEQIASYVKSLHGTKPKTPKEPQGTLCTDQGAAPASGTDSTQKSAAAIQ